MKIIMIIEIHHFSTDTSSVPEILKEYSNLNQDEVYFPEKQQLSNFRVIVSTLMTAGVLVSANFSPNHFTHIVIDEAGQVR